MKSYIMVSSDVFCDNIQNTLFLSTHSSRINRYFQNHSTVNPSQGLKSTQLFSSLHRPQDSTFSFVQDVYQHSGLGWPEVHCRCNWIQFYVKFPFVFPELILKLSLRLPCLWLMCQWDCLPPLPCSAPLSSDYGSYCPAVLGTPFASLWSSLHLATMDSPQESKSISTSVHL